MSTETKVTKKETSIEIASRIDNAVNELLTSKEGGFVKAIKKAEIIEILQSSLTSEVLKPIMSMQNKEYGFLTDRMPTPKNPNPKPYTEDEVKDCFIQAILLGVEPTGNQFNIISGKTYIGLNGCKHRLIKLRCKYRLTFQNSFKKDNKTYKPVLVEWETIDGIKGSKSFEFQITVFEGSSEDFIEGKAKRDVLSWLIEEITGSPLPTGNVTIDSTYEEVNPSTKEIKEVVESKPEISDAEMFERKKQQENLNKHLSGATTLENLEKRWEDRKKYPNMEFSDYVYKELKKKLSGL